MICSLLAYSSDGTVVATLDHLVARDADGNVLGLVDFAAHEASGGALTEIWQVSNAVGSGTWPEFLGGRAHEFRVELDGPSGAKRISALVHKSSGHRRDRAAVEAAIAAVEPDAVGRRDIRHLVGGPDRPLKLDENGRTIGPEQPRLPAGTPTHLPIVGRR
jgi:hypothetical protein